MAAPAWECLDEGAWAANAKPCRGSCAWSAFSGARLLTLRPGKDDCLTELQARSGLRCQSGLILALPCVQGRGGQSSRNGFKTPLTCVW